MDAPIIYIEEEPYDVYFVARSCERMGQSLRVVVDCEDAIDYLAGHGKYADRRLYPVPGLVLLETKLSNSRGLMVLQWIRQQPQFADLPVIVFSNSAVEADIQKARRLGANDYVVKPSNMTETYQLLPTALRPWLGDPVAELRRTTTASAAT